MFARIQGLHGKIKVGIVGRVYNDEFNFIIG